MRGRPGSSDSTATDGAGRVFRDSLIMGTGGLLVALLVAGFLFWRADFGAEWASCNSIPSWPVTDGLVIGQHARGSNDGDRVAYIVGGVRYEFTASSILGPNGSSTTVKYDPADPSRAAMPWDAGGGPFANCRYKTEVAGLALLAGLAWFGYFATTGYREASATNRGSRAHPSIDRE